ncbi:MAG TPA: calcium-binding protein [Croceibacterium sp.]|nr:calcium-binding protein [Croceibacterium sp.]
MMQALAVAVFNGAYLYNAPTGQILAEGIHATGIIMGRGHPHYPPDTFPDTPPEITNDGIIKAASIDPDFESVGILAAHLEHEVMRIVNNGLIEADVAIRGQSATWPYTQAHEWIFNSSTGTIHGDIETDLGRDTLLNDGVFQGDAFLGGDDDSVVNRGTIMGAVYLGEGDDAFDNLGGVQSGGIFGEAGNDTFYVDDQSVVLIELANEGTDTVIASSDYQLGANVENLTLAAGAANLLGVGNELGNTIKGNSGNNILKSGAGSDTLNGGEGNDGLYFGAELTAADSADGGAGTNDQLALQGNYGAIGAPFTFAAGHLVGIEALVLLAGNNTAFGDAGTGSYDYRLKTIDANLGAGERLVVIFNQLRAGEDVSFDGSAESNGAFLTYGGLGADQLTGGQQSDGFYFGVTRWNAGDSVSGQGGSGDQLGLQGNFTGANAVTFGAAQLAGVEGIVLLSAADARFAGAGAAFSYSLTMHDGNVAAGQTLYIIANALAAGETLTFTGAAEANGRFEVFSGAGSDTIGGGLGNDKLYGGGGADTLRGNGGNDIFAYVSAAHSTAAARDSIVDFATGDRIDLSAIDANAVAGANEAFAFIGSGAFSNVPRQLRAVDTGGGVWRVEGDVNGDNSADLVILVTSDHPLTGADFVL